MYLYVLGLATLVVVVFTITLLFRMESKIDRLLRQFEQPEGVAKQVPTSVQDLARAGLKLEAIRQYREETGCSLLEAKQAVDAFIETRENI